MEPFDLEAVYDAEIAPLMTQIIEICAAHRLPMLATFAYAVQEDDGADYCTTALPFEGRTPQSLQDAINAIKPQSSGALAITVIRQ